MLVLSRKNGEKIQIGSDITITVVWCSTGRTQLGIDAPQNLKVRRCELPEVAEETINTKVAATTIA